MKFRIIFNRIKYVMHYRSLVFRLAIISIAVLLVVVTLLFCQNQYAIQLMHDQTTQVIAADLDTQIEKIDAHLDKIDAYIFNLGLLNEDIRSLGVIQKDTSYNRAKKRIFDEIAGNLELYTPVSAFFIYVPSRADAFSVSTQRDSYQWRSRVEDELCKLLVSQLEQGTVVDDQWLEASVGGVGYVFKIRHLYGACIGAYINLPALFDHFKVEPKFDSEVQVLFNMDGHILYEQGEPLESSTLPEPQEIYDERRVSYLGKNKKYLYVSASFSRLPAYMYTIVADREVLNQFYYIRKLLPVIGVAFAFLIPLLVFMNDYLVVRPVKRLVHTMNKVQGGDLQRRMNMEESSLEFRILNQKFNNMMDEIEKLKIEAYEQQLEYSRMELEMLELQLNPHFFANTLNVIYRLAQNNRDEVLENISMGLIRFFRYAINGRSALVPLYSEVAHVRDYLQIQEYRYGSMLDVQLHISDESLKVENEVPRLCIQGLLENSIKHAYVFGQTLRVEIEARIDGDGYLLIRICDNGPGFKSDILNALKEDYSILEKDGHVGLTNLFRRIKIIYGEAAQVQCFNEGNECNAVVGLRFPENRGGEDLKNEHNNC